MAKTETPETETEDGDAPLIDLNDAQVKKMMARAKKDLKLTPIGPSGHVIMADQPARFAAVVKQFLSS